MLKRRRLTPFCKTGNYSHKKLTTFFFGYFCASQLSPVAFLSSFCHISSVENYYENCSSSSPTPPSSKHNICFDRKFHICNYVSQQDEINSKVIFFFVCILDLKRHGTATLDNGPVQEVMQPFNNQKTYRR